MLEEKRDVIDTGVIIARFQTPKLHSQHIELIETVKQRCHNLVIVLGLSPVLCTTRNPLDFQTRRMMIQEIFPEATIAYIKDINDDNLWSAELDRIISNIVPMSGKIALFGSRDSFISHYTGKHKCIELESKILISGTVLREEYSKKALKSEDFRAGVVYAATNRYPISYQTVDIVCIKKGFKEDEVLLCRKPNETRLRFPGGFVDPSDTSLEHAALRELKEETNLSGLNGQYNFKYVGSLRIDDWRYRNEVDKIMTAVFMFEYDHGTAIPGDDIAELRWVGKDSITESMLVPEHFKIWKLFC